MQSFTPAIVVVAFNRPASLQRLLSSISKADYRTTEIPLCFCIDFQDSAANREVREIAEAYDWPHGPKEIIHQTENLGLKTHVLACGDLTERFGSIIMLEDDLYVSPGFYAYTVQALEFYSEDDRIAGISLYNHRVNVTGGRPFEAIHDGSDNYFLQVAASWGQAWTKQHWGSFRKWFSNNLGITEFVNMPSYIMNWPDTSWLKHYIHYLVVEGKFFVYPRIGLTTNFSDVGQHNSKNVPFYQVPIIVTTKEFRFYSLDSSVAVYDAYFEVLPAVLKTKCEVFANLDFSVNLYGLKTTEQLDSEYIIVGHNHENAIIRFAMSLKPIDANLFMALPGEGISVLKSEDYINSGAISREDRKARFDYDSRAISFKEKVVNIFDMCMSRIWK
jgi:glycosyltransferase involved in cell wall biosynthesis